MKSLLALVTFVLASSSVASAADAERIIVIRPARPERVVVRIERPRFERVIHVQRERVVIERHYGRR